MRQMLYLSVLLTSHSSGSYCACLPVKRVQKTRRAKTTAGAGPHHHSGSKRARQEDKGSEHGSEQKKSKPSPAKPAQKKGPLDSFFIKNPA